MKRKNKDNWIFRQRFAKMLQFITKAKDKEQQLLQDELQQRIEKLEAMTKIT